MTTKSTIIAAEKRSMLASRPRRRRYPPPMSPPPPIVPPSPVAFGVWRRMPSIASTPITTWATVSTVFTQPRLLGKARAEYRWIKAIPPRIDRGGRSPDISPFVVASSRNVRSVYLRPASTLGHRRPHHGGPPGVSIPRGGLRRPATATGAAARAGAARPRRRRPGHAPTQRPGALRAFALADRRRATEHPRGGLRVRAAAARAGAGDGATPRRCRHGH